MSVKYKRVLLKLSGEAVSGGEKGIINFEFLSKIASVIKACRDEGVQMAVMIGAGNIWRGRQGGNMNRCRADHMGMLATMINCLALQQELENQQVDAVTMTPVEMESFADKYSARQAVSALNAGKIVLLGCGSGSPFFSTDTAAVLRAAEINADVVLMAKNIDGIYSADPKKDANAVKFDEITYKEILENEIRAYDLTATAFCMDNNIKTYAFELKDPMNIYRVIMGEKVGTETHN
ncbi:MAG: UMP kinase [Clostridia bacterium]|nr:UMP kinase [Clostridia bacterium]